MNDIFDHLPDGRPVHRVTLSNGRLSARILTFGAIVQDLRLDGVDFPLVLGADRITPYLGPMRYFGGMVGRYANRIGGGRFTLNGQTIQLSRNQDGRHCLHGGAIGSAEQLWQIRAHTSDSLALALTLADGEMGFPGEMTVDLIISLAQDRLCFDIKAISDRDTICNFAHHGYFVLDGSGSIAAHRLEIEADNVLEIDADLIPTGAIVPVSQAGLDFRAARSLRKVALDHNFCLSDRCMPLRSVARLCSDLSGLAMQIATTEPGLQVYTANHLPVADLRGLGGMVYRRHAGIALEAQNWPDAPNHPAFPSALLRAGDVYHQRTSYGFLVPQDAGSQNKD
jgi:aldose 1-epimerase